MTNYNDFYITQQGYKKLTAAIDKLTKIDAKNIINEIAEARSKGDLSENAEYKYAKEKQKIIGEKIRVLQNYRDNANIYDKPSKSNEVRFGCSVKLLNLNTDKEVLYHIAGEYESDLTKNIISFKSPIAQALLGKKVDDLVEINVPNGMISYKIINLQFKTFEV